MTINHGRIFAHAARSYANKRLHFTGFFKNTLIRASFLSAATIFAAITIHPVLGIAAISGPMWLLGKGIASLMRLNKAVRIFGEIRSTDNVSVNRAATELSKIERDDPKAHYNLLGKLINRGFMDTLNKVDSRRPKNISEIVNPTEEAMEKASTEKYRKD